MTRPTFFVAGAVALGVRWLASHRRLAPSLAALAIALIVALPWVARSSALLGRAVFISSSFEDVWKGNNPSASGSSYLPNGQDVFSAAPTELQLRFVQPGSCSSTSYLRRKSSTSSASTRTISWR